MPDFWLTSGFHLLERDAAGHLLVTDDFLRAYFCRPELEPVAESCDTEVALRDALIAEPRRPVSDEQLAMLADPDARDNYAVVLRYRDFLLAHRTLEAGYLALFRGTGAVRLPPEFLDQMVHAILRSILDGCRDPLRLRAAELLFRCQKVSVQNGALLLADEEIVEMYAATRGSSMSLVQLLDDAEAPARSVELDVLSRDNADAYWGRSDRFDTVLDVSFARPGLDALCRVLEAWVGHFLAVEVRIHPVQSIKDDRWIWHIGLDAEVSAILNDLYEGREVEDGRLRRLVSLFRLDVANPAAMLPQVAGRPIYLGMAMTADQRLRLKPQNLLVNLPLASVA